MGIEDNIVVTLKRDEFSGHVCAYLADPPSGVIFARHSLMFKRANKHLKRKQEEEELGIDGDVKAVLGLNDTDSDESESDSDSSDDSSEDEAADDDEQASESGNASSEEDEAEGVEAEKQEEAPLMSVQEALTDPIYELPRRAGVKACIICPSRVLKTPKMVETHLNSGVRMCVLY